MKRSVKIISAFTVSLLATSVSAQNETDALRYSNIGFGGTARFNGMSGAFGALGGDMSCMTTNPAGLGRYTKSEFNFSLLYQDINNKVNYLGNQTNGGVGNFNLGGLGFVATKQLNGSDWRYFQFGMGYNRNTFFHTHFVLDGVNYNSSIADVFRAQANGYTTADLAQYLPNSAELAYQAYVIDPTDTMSSTTTYTDRVPPGMGVHQTRTYDRTGNMSETDFAFAGNYNDKLYIGGTIGLPSIRFNESWNHQETMIDPDSATTLSSINYSQNLNSRGRGFNLKFGAIFLPVDWFRIGAAIHTPSYLVFTDTWNNNVSSSFDDGTKFSIDGPASNYTWRMRTPARYTGSLGVILMKKIALDVDAEYVNYASMKMRPHWSDPSGYSFSAENAAILNNYRSTVNLRAGAEVRLKFLYLRGGFAWYGSPYKAGMTTSQMGTTTTSAGIGFKNKGFSVDLGLNIIHYSQDVYPYDPVLFTSTGPGVVNTNIVRTSLTCGWRF